MQKISAHGAIRADKQQPPCNHPHRCTEAKANDRQGRPLTGQLMKNPDPHCIQRMAYEHTQSWQQQQCL
jgi:hypothetical protein